MISALKSTWSSFVGYFIRLPRFAGRCDLFLFAFVFFFRGFFPFPPLDDEEELDELDEEEPDDEEELVDDPDRERLRFVERLRLRDRDDRYPEVPGCPGSLD